ncbi:MULTISPECIES: aminotransferase class I/II-fold pyridoxal phosphate-dependent enzyme [Arthrobacter]|uniref:Aminotransferase class I/II-fold pyridoxal phosphate-dependent enzyme n=2 Tax=Arthrobacter TaxID=1663 RepID=A0ABU9KHJ8_9MICC|nr:aminotransferase class I/II-fold pyridoxal phosphate-dependent enzyme [Arthrobacter sp. YJM1]MDP5226681.1 aminotransferase class I/II-fold pyridoxal phosphate-dependent enzyme [Arthrobacter sp. YJM1]
MEHSLPLNPDSVVVAGGRPARERDGAVNPPVVLSSTFVGTGPLGPGDRGYGRYANPSWEPFEEVLGELEGGTEPALLFASGLAAVSAALSLVPLGGIVVMPEHSYAGTVQQAAELAAKGLLSLRLVDITDTEQVLSALRREGVSADLLWLESPTNPMLGVADLPVLLAAAREAGILTVVDNTFCTPLVQQPLTLGADLVLHSVTKYLAGHSDVVLGALVPRTAELRSTLLHHRTIHGSIAGPWEAWLALRGIRTLAVRIERSQVTAQLLAERLEAHPAVERVRFPGLPSDPGHDRARAQLKGFGSILCIEVAAGGGRSGAENADALVTGLGLWLPATSLGGVESLIERRRRHLAEPHSVPDNLVRLSVGIENAEDLWADLERSLDALPRG